MFKIPRISKHSVKPSYTFYCVFPETIVYHNYVRNLYSWNYRAAMQVFPKAIVRKLFR